MSYISIGVGKPEMVVPLDDRSGRHRAEVLVDVLKAAPKYSLGLIGYGFSLDHYSDRISVHKESIEEAVRASHPAPATWSGACGVVVEALYRGADGFLEAFPSNAEEIIRLACQAGEIPGSVHFVTPLRLSAIFLCEEHTWDEELRSFFGVKKKSKVTAPKRVEKLIRQAALGAKAMLETALEDVLPSGMRRPQVEMLSDKKPLSSLPNDPADITKLKIEPIIQHRTYQAVELASLTEVSKYDAVLHPPETIGAMALSGIVDALRRQRAYFTYRDGTVPCAEVEGGSGDPRIPPEYFRAGGNLSTTLTHLGYVSTDHTFVGLIPAAVQNVLRKFGDSQGRRVDFPKPVIGWGLSEDNKLRRIEAEHAAVKTRIKDARLRLFDLAPSAIRGLIEGLHKDIQKEERPQGVA